MLKYLSPYRNTNLLIHDKDNPLKDVNNLCYLLKKFLDSHSRFEIKDLRNYLNLFSCMVNEPYNKLEIVKIILDKAAYITLKIFIIEISTLKNNDK